MVGGSVGQIDAMTLSGECMESCNTRRRGNLNKKVSHSNHQQRRHSEMCSSSSWSVYLIVSAHLPKTYVGVTTNFSRRLKQHNGELKGGAKATRAGRPWVCACLVQGFKGRSEACEFESKWKSFSRKLHRKRNIEDLGKKEDHGSLFLLQHREAALQRLKGSFDCSHLEINWEFQCLSSSSD
ncbi:excinuclease ABC, C subunit, N-terminal [Tasmannia lanceolata]|uniref:excinuclease ABC, C subunit, N-terminal n=1 Tax=Tasmannia lanceolata TaxID=3420 RepID=UPI00406404C2